jgi:hypothetical protein
MYASSAQYVLVSISISDVLRYICSNKHWHILVGRWKFLEMQEWICDMGSGIAMKKQQHTSVC